MPFVLRQVTPVRLSRLNTKLEDNDDDDIRQFISNQTLSACLRQLASLVSLASDIFTHCHDEANVLHQRTIQLRQRLDRLQSNADQRLDSRSVAIRKFLSSMFRTSSGGLHICVGVPSFPVSGSTSTTLSTGGTFEKSFWVLFFLFRCSNKRVRLSFCL